MVLIALTFIATMTSVLSGVIGMGGGIVLLSLMTFFLPWAVLIPVHGVVQLISNSSRCFLLRRKIALKLFIPYLLGTPIGIVAATFIVGQLSNPQAPMLLVVALIFYVLFKPKRMPALKIPPWAFSILGVVTGFFTLLVGATGPLMAPFFLRDDIDKKEIVATKAACQMVGHLLKLPAFYYLGFQYLEHSSLLVLMSLGALLGTKLGIMILGRINESVFRILYKMALAAAAARIIYKFFVV